LLTISLSCMQSSYIYNNLTARIHFSRTNSCMIKKQPFQNVSVLIFSIFLFIYGCSKNNSPDSNSNSTSTLSISTTSLAIASLSNSKDTFRINSSATWTAASDQSWVTLSQTSGTGNSSVIITAVANAGDSSIRNAFITVSATGLNDQKINVKQDAGIVVVAGNGTKSSGLNELDLPLGVTSRKEVALRASADSPPFPVSGLNI